MKVTFFSAFSAYHVLKAKGKEGPVDVKVKLAGYNQDVLAKAGITDAVSNFLLVSSFP